MVHLRKATAQDVLTARALIHWMGIHLYSQDWRRFLATVDEQGLLITIGQVKSHSDDSHGLVSIAVQPEWQSNRIGRDLA